MARAKMRVPLATSPVDTIELSEKVYKKYMADGDKSPLKSMEDYDWKEIGPMAAEALQFHADAEANKKKAEEQYRERDRRLKILDLANRASRDVLSGVYAKNMKKMGDYGFVVDDTPKVKKEKMAKGDK